MFHIGMTQWIVGDEPLEVSCARLKNCGYDGIELAAVLCAGFSMRAGI